MRPDDVIARYGGEELAVILPETDLAGGIRIADELRKMIATETFVFEDEDIDVTISCGVAQLEPKWRSYDFVEAADEQLYEAKRAGRNRVCPELAIAARDVLGSPPMRVDRRGPRFDVARVLSARGGRGAPDRVAAGRYLSRDSHARFDSPPFDNSAMDGYAVRADDVAASAERPRPSTPVRGNRARAGRSPSPAPGTACRIFTGAPMPQGATRWSSRKTPIATATEVDDSRASTVGKHVRAQGSDVSSGTLTPAGRRLDSGPARSASSRARTSTRAGLRAAASRLALDGRRASAARRRRSSPV